MELYQSLQKLLADKKLVDSLDPETRYCFLCVHRGCDCGAELESRSLGVPALTAPLSRQFLPLRRVPHPPWTPLRRCLLRELCACLTPASCPAPLLSVLRLPAFSPLPVCQLSFPTRWTGSSSRAGPGLICSLLHLSTPQPWPAAGPSPGNGFL